ncbi:MAG: phosphatase [Peptococcaceae bacterium]|jgi:putative hydrolase|nr:phosphatase [Peptococcaceae bacterium]
MEILADLHTHTVSSGHAYSTLTENARAAAEKGMRLLGITDHGPAMPGGPDLYHFGNLHVLPGELFGVRILYGAETNIVSREGELDLPVRYLRKMQIVLAGLHVYCYPGGSREQNTQALIKVMQNPFVDMIAHPERVGFDADLERIAQASAEWGVPIEINNATLRSSKQGAETNASALAEAAAHYQSPVILSSDAHFWDRIGELDRALAVAKNAGISEQQILNISPDRVLHYLHHRHAKRPK